MTSSAYNPASNGLAENAVKTCKALLSKTKADKSSFKQALCDWRNTPRQDGTAPADMLFGFRQRTPGLPRLSRPSFVHDRLEKAQTRHKDREKQYSKRGGRHLSTLPPGTPAVMKGKGGWEEEVIVEKGRPSGRSYDLVREGGEKTTRNRSQIKPKPSPS